MNIFLIIQILVIIFFFVMFYRRSDFTWAVGLLTVTSAVLLNVIWAIFGLGDLAESAGLWTQILGGLVFGGAAIWLVGLLRPHMGDGFIPSAVATASDNGSSGMNGSSPSQNPNIENLLSRRAVGMQNESSEYDRQLLFDQILQNLSNEDVRDLMFDLEISENEVVAPMRNMNQTIHNIIDLAADRDQTADLALAVERILTPVPPDHFPRLSRISTETPPTILRRYLLTFYDLKMLEEMSGELEIDWERLGIGSKQQKVRNLLLWIRRSNRMGELIEAMHARPVVSGNVELK